MRKNSVSTWKMFMMSLKQIVLKKKSFVIFVVDGLVEKIDDHRSVHEKIETSTRQLLHCKFCEETFHVKRELMTHKKNRHIYKVSICTKFVSGSCKFGD